MPGSGISVLILTANRVPRLARCLQALAEGVRVPDEVVLVVNEEGDETLEFLDTVEIPFPVVPVRGPGGGYAESRNAGMRATSYDRVAILDDDCYADRWWLRRMEDALELHEAVGGLVLPARRHKVPPDFSPQLNWLVGLSPPGYFDEVTGRVDLPSTSNVALRRNVWERHPFQEMGGTLSGGGEGDDYLLGREDAQWWRRLRDAGIDTFVETNAIVWHDIPPERYSAEAIASRAESDGRAHWRREQPRRETASAARDILSTAPAIAAETLLNEDVTFAESRRLHRTWAKRQAALLDEAVHDFEGGISPQRRALEFAKQGGRLASHLVRPLVRLGAVRAHHAFRTTRPLPADPSALRRIAILSYNFLGDSILLIPMMKAIRAAAPDCRITLISAEYLRPLFEGLDCIDRFAALPDSLPPADPRSTRTIRNAIRENDPDAILLAYWHNAPPLGIFTATDAPIFCWDHDNGIRRELWKDLAAIHVRKDLRQPEPVSLLNLLAPLGIAAEPQRVRWTPPDAAVSRVKRILEPRGIEPGRFACVPLDTPGDSPKAWPVERYADVARHLSERHALPCVFVGTRSGKGSFEALNDLPESCVSLHGVVDVAELGALLSMARIAIGVDSGPMHLSQAVRTPTVALFSHASEAQWGPMPRVRSDGRRPLPFRAVRADDAPADWTEEEKARHPRNERVARIAVGRVIGEIDDLIAATASLPGVV